MFHNKPKKKIKKVAMHAVKFLKGRSKKVQASLDKQFLH